MQAKERHAYLGLEGTTLVVRIPMRFQHRGGRKRIVAPDGSAIVPTRSRSLTARWSRRSRGRGDGSACSMRGVYTTVSEIGDAENISKSYVSRILRLALLAPDIVEAILAGKTDQALMLEQLERPLPASWDEQRARILEPWMS